MICPKCNTNELLYEEGCNALSRVDNSTEICDDCGMAEAIDDMGELVW